MSITSFSFWFLYLLVYMTLSYLQCPSISSWENNLKIMNNAPPDCFLFPCWYIFLLPYHIKKARYPILKHDAAYCCLHYSQVSVCISWRHFISGKYLKRLPYYNSYADRHLYYSLMFGGSPFTKWQYACFCLYSLW